MRRSILYAARRDASWTSFKSRSISRRIGMDRVTIPSRSTNATSALSTRRSAERPSRLPEQWLSAGGFSVGRRAGVPRSRRAYTRAIESRAVGLVQLSDHYVTGLFRSRNVNLLVRSADSVIRRGMIRSVSAVSKLCAVAPRHVAAFRLAPSCRHSTWQGEGYALPRCIPTCAAARALKTRPVFRLSGHCRAADYPVEVRR